MRRFLSNLLFLILFLSAATLLIAQDKSSMTGVVTDVSGALVPDTTVVLSNPHTAVSFSQTTDNKGSYRFTNIPPGQGYQATFTHQGFATTQIKNLDLEIGTTRTQDAKLQAGAAQTIEVICQRHHRDHQHHRRLRRQQHLAGGSQRAPCPGPR